LAGYFGYNLRFVQNITDVDDKIILRGRQQYLLADFKSKNPTVTDELINTTIKAFDAYVKKNLPLLSADVNIGTFNEESAKQYANVIQGKSVDGVGPAGDKEAKIKMHLRTAGTAATALLAPSKTTPEDVETFYAGAEDVLLPYLDSLYGTTIDASDHTVFTRLTQKYEARFNEDMQSLNVLDPNVVTRVTEYGDQIVTFVEKIVANGFAYSTSDGSVYFDIEAFEKVPGNHYARLEPWNRGDKGLQADGEGALSTQKTSEKRSESDFALWKSSKPGEPAWKSPWGPGRPGWHIECSVMASDVLGEQMDIHSGGIDLCFPHHDKYEFLQDLMDLLLILKVNLHSQKHIGRRKKVATSGSITSSTWAISQFLEVRCRRVSRTLRRSERLSHAETGTREACASSSFSADGTMVSKSQTTCERVVPHGRAT
jgi:cysteinyl-tRNA synthetase